MKKVLSVIFIFLNLALISQEYFPNNTLETEIDILDINTNTRIGAIGEIGVVSSSFYKDAGLYQNPALLSVNSL